MQVFEMVFVKYSSMYCGLDVNYVNVESTTGRNEELSFPNCDGFSADTLQLALDCDGALTHRMMTLFLVSSDLTAEFRLRSLI
jgi:hypothetical protein